MRGKFITLEGIDGAGKSTHLDWLARFLQQRGIAVKVTREPGGTAIGERLRELLLQGGERLHPETEALLMFVARREHLDKVIVPALASGTWVVCDRFTDATYAYQAGGSGVGWARIAALEQWVQQDLQPDLTLMLDVDPVIGRQRSTRTKAPDRFEAEQQSYFQRVRAAYLRRAQEAPGRIRVIDANADLSKVKIQLEDIVSTFCSTIVINR